MTRLATTPAILGLLVSGMVATGLPAGCGSNQVAIGQQNVDAQASGLDAPVGSGGAGGASSTATAGGNGAGVGVTASGGSARTGGTTVIGSGGNAGVISSGGTFGSGGASASGGTTGTGTGCAPGWTPCCSQCLSPAAGICAPCPPMGGGGSTGGTTGTGGTAGAGGATRTGGSTGAGGTTRTGGTTGTGGSTGTGGTGGSTGKTCGGIAGLLCAAGEFCETPAGSCNEPEGSGTCVANAGLGCITIYQPVCGCDGKTYPSDCDRRAAGVSKKSDGTCPTTDASAGTCSQVTTQTECDSRSDCHSVFLPGTTCACAAVGCCQLFNRCADGGRANCTGPVACLAPQPLCAPPYALSYTNVCFEGCVLQSECASADGGVKDAATDLGTTRYATAYLQWEAPGGIAGTDPAIVVDGSGRVDTWSRVNGFSPETAAPSSPTGTYTLTTAEVDDLFARLASVNFSQLPHPGIGWECYPRLYFRLCTGCAATTLSYDVPPEVLPEMEPVWAWFDRLLTATDYTNPRTYCQLPAAANCTATGGQVSSALCCNSATDFPNSCLTGACGCAPASSHTVSTCNCAVGCFMPAYGCVGPAGMCTVGADQTCNDNPSISSLHGHCVADGRCLCGSGLLLASGKCQ